MPRVLNKKVNRFILDNQVYVGRPSKWGNPFVVDRDGTREQVIELYEKFLLTSALWHHLDELRGKDLVCWCAPLPCHADVLLKYANAVA